MAACRVREGGIVVTEVFEESVGSGSDRSACVAVTSRDDMSSSSSTREGAMVNYLWTAEEGVVVAMDLFGRSLFVAGCLARLIFCAPATPSGWLIDELIHRSH